MTERTENLEYLTYVTKAQKTQIGEKLSSEIMFVKEIVHFL